MFVEESDKASIEPRSMPAFRISSRCYARSASPTSSICASPLHSFARLREELERARGALEERKVIDRAKGIPTKATES